MEEIESIFVATAAAKEHDCEDPNCIPCAKKEASKHTKAYENLMGKIHDEADKKARAAGHEPFKDKEKNKAYYDAVSHHIAHHKDIKKLSDLKQKSAQARIRYKRLVRTHKIESSVDDDDYDRDMELDAFLGMGEPKNPHELGKTGSEARAKAKHWTKKADKIHDKMHSDAVKKAKSTGYKPGHVEHDSEVIKHMKEHPSYNHLQETKKTAKEHREHYKKKFSGSPPSHRYYMV